MKQEQNILNVSVRRFTNFFPKFEHDALQKSVLLVDFEKMMSNEYLIATFAFNKAENEAQRDLLFSFEN